MGVKYVKTGIIKTSKVQWSKKELIERLFHDQVKHSKARGHLPPEYTKEQLVDLIMNDPEYDTLYNTWVANGLLSDDKPSIDRLDDKKGYSFDNIRLVTWDINNKKGYEDRKKPVLQYTMDGVLVSRHSSIRDAMRVTGINEDDIQNAMQKGNYRSHNYLWFFESIFTEELLKSRIEHYRSKRDLNPVLQYDKDGNLINEFQDIITTMKIGGFDKGNVRKCVKGLSNSVNGFLFIYKDDISTLDDRLKKLNVSVAKTNRTFKLYDFDMTFIGDFTSAAKIAEFLNIASNNVMLPLRRHMLIKSRYICIPSEMKDTAAYIEKLQKDYRDKGKDVVHLYKGRLYIFNSINSLCKTFKTEFDIDYSIRNVTKWVADRSNRVFYMLKDRKEYEIKKV